MNFKRFFLIYTLLPLFILAAAGSFFRFQILSDYMVTYEGWCDEYTEECFIGCEDDECSEEYYFTYVSRHANNILALCGSDITDCEDADYCQEEENKCQVEYCDAEVDECESFTESDALLDEDL